MTGSPDLERPLRTIPEVVADLAVLRQHAIRSADRAYEERLTRQMDALMQAHRERTKEGAGDA